MQLRLSFLETPDPVQQIWESLSDELRQTVTIRLSALMQKTALKTETEEEQDDD